MPELILLADGKPLLRCPLHGQVVSVGRSAANDISVPDESLPALHCSFEPIPGGKYQVVDRGGQGVFIHGDEYEHKDLEDGDEVTLGHLVGRFVKVGSEEGDDAKQHPSATTDRTQRTGILRTSATGEAKLTRLDIRIRLPASAGGGQLEIPPNGLRFGAN